MVYLILIIVMYYLKRKSDKFTGKIFAKQDTVCYFKAESNYGKERFFYETKFNRRIFKNPPAG